MKRNSLATAIALALMVAGCEKSAETAAPGSAANTAAATPEVVAVGEVVATVNGKPISKSAFESGRTERRTLSDQ